MQLAPGKTRTKLLRAQTIFSPQSLFSAYPVPLVCLSASVFFLGQLPLLPRLHAEYQLPSTPELTPHWLSCTKKLHLSRIPNILLLLIFLNSKQILLVPKRYSENSFQPLPYGYSVPFLKFAPSPSREILCICDNICLPILLFPFF